MKGLLIIPLLLSMEIAAAGPIYQWTDSAGQVHYSDKAPENAQNLKRLRNSDLPHVHSEKPPTRTNSTSQYRNAAPQANLVKASKDDYQCRNYRKRLEKTEDQLNRRSLDQDRDHLWKLRDIYSKKVREFCD